ncbi:alpha/beta hydrolase [Parasediminibacterium sp. JCM 36343]|uniref:alpha/beta hydrolase n=1 Tax=Parasediminibacterium sp. JCM 36343 TaxID=3374279 RepID=UPI00397D6DD0
MQTVYFISGLGADKRAFAFLNLSFCKPIFIEWIVPLPKETMASYAGRLKAVITEPNPILVGLSFGGMLATEMAKTDPTLKAILISSNKTASEFPFWLRLGKYFPIYKWMPGSVTKSRPAFRFFCWMLGAKTEKGKKLLWQIIQDTDIPFSQWVIEAIMQWGNDVIPPNITHIHGKADRLLPYYLIKNPNYTIPTGGHSMVMAYAKEISGLLKVLIDKP